MYIIVYTFKYLITDIHNLRSISTLVGLYLQVQYEAVQVKIWSLLVFSDEFISKEAKTAGMNIIIMITYHKRKPEAKLVFWECLKCSL
jgi:hypothetical protein